ncbi:A-kinase anchor protein 17A-like [Orycteropus afer afer]|uniref:A-kinase anchor protein 17A-like n=1 Tax=Orycteropus afer afer TaxID=1230840 RepID=A0A8B7BDT4_ORYAF|nr:A-kinase anchor protein 17A-like [Orycteropus afer afer]
MAAATIVHDTSEAVELCPPHGLYLKPITKMTISVALPQLKQPGKSISNWEVMERLKGMVHSHQFSTLRIAKSTMDFIRFEGEVENKSLVKSFLACLDGKTIKLSGFSDILKVRAAEFKIDFPTRHDWDSFFRDAKDMNETLPGERPDTIHLEGLPCKWFARKESGSEKPSEEVLVRVFEKFGEIRNVDIPMLDPYREEMTGRNFHTFSFGGHLNFEAYVQYREYAGFIKAMSALRGMKLMFKGEDGKAVACNIKVSFDSTKHLSDASIRKRQLERQKLQELEQQREEQKRREKAAEEKQRAEESVMKAVPAVGAHVAESCCPRLSRAVILEQVATTFSRGAIGRRVLCFPRVPVRPVDSLSGRERGLFSGLRRRLPVPGRTLLLRLPSCCVAFVLLSTAQPLNPWDAALRVAGMLPRCQPGFQTETRKEGLAVDPQITAAESPVGSRGQICDRQGWRGAGQRGLRWGGRHWVGLA